MPDAFSRRAVLQTAGASGLAAAIGLPAVPRHAFAQADGRPWAILTDAEARWLAAACDVLIPEDEYPSASQAGVVDFIDLQMSTDYGQGAGLYLEGPFFEGTPEQGWQIDKTPAELLLQGIADLNAEGTPIQDLDEAGRADFIERLSTREQPIGGGTKATDFFTLLQSLTNEGYFADPIYLGNYDYAGWRMVGFPGAHAYYLERVDNHGISAPPPPMGIAHQPRGRSTLPRPIPTGDQTTGDRADG
jgi:hypothetical protein